MSKMSKAVAVLGVVAGLGVAAMPLATYAANPETINLNVQVVDKIELSASETSLNMNPVNGGDIAEATTDLTVTTSNTKGYTLNAKTSDVNLTSGENNIIAAGVPQANATTSAWGLKAGTKTFQNYAGLTTADQLVKETNGAPSGNTDATQVTFGVATAAGQAAGTYTGDAIFTAVAKFQ